MLVFLKPEREEINKVFAGMFRATFTMVNENKVGAQAIEIEGGSSKEIVTCVYFNFLWPWFCSLSRKGLRLTELRLSYNVDQGRVT